MWIDIGFSSSSSSSTWYTYSRFFRSLVFYVDFQCRRSKEKIQFTHYHHDDWAKVCFFLRDVVVLYKNWLKLFLCYHSHSRVSGQFPVIQLWMKWLKKMKMFFILNAVFVFVYDFSLKPLNTYYTRIYIERMRKMVQFFSYCKTLVSFNFLHFPLFAFFLFIIIIIMMKIPTTTTFSFNQELWSCDWVNFFWKICRQRKWKWNTS